MASQRIRAVSQKDTPVTEEELQRAIDRGAKNPQPVRACGVRVGADKKSLALDLGRNTWVTIPFELLPEFLPLQPEQLDQVELGFCNTAVVVESADLHVSVKGILKAAGLVQIAPPVMENGLRVSVYPSDSGNW